MDARIQGLWADRLESGTVPQGHGRLGDSTGARCCLGVLCDIAVEEGVIQGGLDDMGHMRYSGDPENGDTPDEWEGGVLPLAVRRWAGLDSANPDLMLTDADGLTDYGVPATGYRTLSALNDGQERDGEPIWERQAFPTIASIIRMHF